MPPHKPHKVIGGVECKLCALCKEYLPLTQFHKQKGSVDGLRFACKECRKIETPEQRERRLAVKSAYNKTHRKEIAIKAKEYAEKNKDLMVQKRAQRYRKDIVASRKKVIDEYYKYRDKRLVSQSIYKHKRRALERKLHSTLTSAQWEHCKSYFGEKCAYCGNKLPLEQEHFVPISKNGEFTLNNIICACKSCNTSKRNKDFFDWYPRQPYYSKQRERKILTYLNYNGRTQQLTLF